MVFFAFFVLDSEVQTYIEAKVCTKGGRTEMVGFPLIGAFLKVIEDTAKYNGAKRISKIWLTAGKGMLFKGNTSAYLEYILKGTAARDAEIYIKYGHTAGRCRVCGLVFTFEKEMACPECGGAGDSICLEKRFIIDRMDIER
jgi:Zn finger protein HypA/HybF involved in hydrogenase expression